MLKVNHKINRSEQKQTFFTKLNHALHKFVVILIALYIFPPLNAEPLTISNKNIKLKISPENGGKIIALESAGFKYELKKNEYEKLTTGLAKDRVLEDDWEFTRNNYKVINKDKQCVMLKTVGKNPPFDRLEITKEIRVPDDGAYVKVKLIYKNLIPTGGEFKIIPYIHNEFNLSFPQSNDLFLQPHTNGIQINIPQSSVTVQPTILTNSNWTAFYNSRLASGLLVLSRTAAKVLYDYISSSQNIGSLEMLFPAVTPIPQSELEYYLVPIVNDKAAGTPPIKPFPALPSVFSKVKNSNGEKTSLTALAQEGQSNQPLQIKFWKHAAILSPDLSIPMFFGVRNIKRYNQILFVLDLPQGLNMTGFCAGYWNLIKEKMELISNSVIMKNGHKFQRLKFSITPYIMKKWQQSFCRVFVKAGPGTVSQPIYYHAVHDGKVMPELKLPVEVINIPSSSIPKKFKLFMGMDYALLKNYPDGIEALKHLGINSICLNYNVPSKEVPISALRDFLDVYKKQGFLTATMGWGFMQPRYYGGFNLASNNAKTQEELGAIDIDGKPVRYFDFTARGPWMKNVVDHMLDKAVKPGFDIIFGDWEPYFSGQRISFTERTITKFRDYFKKNYPDMTFIDPKNIAKTPDKYPKYNNIWIDFKCHEVSDYVRTIIADLKKKVPEAKIGWSVNVEESDISCKTSHLMNYTEICGLIDYLQPMLYYNEYGIMSEYKTKVAICKKFAAKGGKALIWPVLTLGFWDKANNFPEKHSFYLLLETLMAQCNSSYIWPGFAGASGQGLILVRQSDGSDSQIRRHGIYWAAF